MDHLVEDLRRVVDYQFALAARVRASYAGESSRSSEKDEEITFLKA